MPTAAILLSLTFLIVMAGAAMRATGPFCTGVRCGQSAIVAFSLILVFAVTACGGSVVDTEHKCDGSTSSSFGQVLSRDALAVVGDIRSSTTMGIVETTRADGSRVREIEWLSAYTITNLTEDEVCVQDIRVEFSENRDPSTGKTLALRSNGASRLVEIYNDPTSLRKHDPTVTRQPPFGLDPGVNVVVIFHQYFTLTADDVPVPLNVNDDVSQHLGPLFVGLPRSPDGRYQCVPEYSGLRTVVESNLGTSTIETANAIMPVGCYFNIPPR